MESRVNDSEWILLHDKSSPVFCSKIICEQADFYSSVWVRLQTPCSSWSPAPGALLGLPGAVAQSHLVLRKYLNHLFTHSISFHYNWPPLFQFSKLILVLLFIWNDFHSSGVHDQVTVTVSCPLSSIMFCVHSDPDPATDFRMNSKKPWKLNRARQTRVVFCWNPTLLTHVALLLTQVFAGIIFSRDFINAKSKQTAITGKYT